MDMEEQNNLLIRIDERTKNIEEKMCSFVTRAEFVPVKIVAFGLVGILCIAVVGALIDQILK